MGGYYCPAGTANPYKLCPSGNYCPVGSASPVPCASGTYSLNQTGALACSPCNAGYYCDSTVSVFTSLICPVRSYCPTGSAYPNYCPNGTFGNATGLVSSAGCYNCPPSKYCDNGAVLGDCNAGYFCRYAQNTPSPYWDLSAYGQPADQLAYLMTKDGGQCPPGHYCPIGTIDPIPCSNNTVRVDVGGVSQLDCGPCPSGATCARGNPVPVLCAQGKYCIPGLDPIDCPLGKKRRLT